MDSEVSVMGLLYMSPHENEFMTSRITEASRLLGQEAYLYQVAKKSIDLQNDPTYDYLDPIRINFILDENPKPVLKRNGWYVEDEELPYLGYFTLQDDDYSDVSITIGAKIEIIATGITNNNLISEFLISNVKANALIPTYWTCKLVPYRPKLKIAEVNDKETPKDNSDLGFNYVRRNQ